VALGEKDEQESGEEGDALFARERDQDGCGGWVKV
jgi:hypothetical protein